MMSPLFLVAGGRRDGRSDHTGASTPCNTQVQGNATMEQAGPGGVANHSSVQLPLMAVYFHTSLVTVCSGVIWHAITKIACKKCMLC